MAKIWSRCLSRLKQFSPGGSKKVEYLHIETSNECNFRCRMCPLIVARESGARPAGIGRGMMSFADFRTILDKIPLHEVRSASVQGFGEVMLNPDFLEIARYAKSKGLRVGFNTNMSLATEEVAEQLVGCGIDELDFSIDATDPALFAYLREGTPLPVLLDNVAGFLRARRGSSPQLGFRVVASRHNLAEVPALVDLAVKFGACRVVFQDLAGDDANPDIQACRLDQAGYQQLTSLSAMAQAAHPEVTIQVENFHRLQPRRNGHTLCQAPWNEIYVRVDGFLTPCCQVQDPSVLGYANLLTQDFDEIWNGPAYRQFRSELHRGRPRACSCCTVY